MEFEEQPWIFDRGLSSYSQRIPVECSSTHFPICFEISEAPSFTNGQVSSTHPEQFGLNVRMERSLWESTGESRIHLSCLKRPHSTVAHIRAGKMPLPTSPCPIQCPDINVRCAHDATTSIPTITPKTYSVIREQFYNAPWRRAGELEPSDPTTGRSVLHTLLEECTSGNKGHTSRCCLCDKVFNRVDRAITHLRHQHLDHRPFWCKGICGTKGWYDALRCVFLKCP